MFHIGTYCEWFLKNSSTKFIIKGSMSPASGKAACVHEEAAWRIPNVTLTVSDFFSASLTIHLNPFILFDGTIKKFSQKTHLAYRMCLPDSEAK